MIAVCKNNYRAMAGYILLEVLIAIFILAFGLLSLASAGVAALRRTHDAYLYSLAAVTAANLHEAVQAGDRDKYYGDIWHAQLSDNLPDGEGALSGSEVSVCWKQHFTQTNKICIKLGASN